MKYLSVVVVIPGNLVEVPFLSFPGLPILVCTALVAMAAGLYLPSFILARRRAVLLQLAGMALLIAAPLVTRLLSSRSGLRFVFDYNLLFYLAFLGIGVQYMVAGKAPAVAPAAPGAMATSVKLVCLGLFLALALPAAAHPQAAVDAGPLALGFGLLDFLEFETAHHGVAGALSGFLTGNFTFDFVRGLFPSWWWEEGPVVVPQTEGPAGGAPPEAPEVAPPTGPAHGEVLTVRDHRGVEIEITYDAETGQWVTPDNTWFDPERAEQARAEYEAQRAWSGAELDRMIAADLAEIERLRREAKTKRQREILEKMQEAWAEEAAMWKQQADAEDRWLTIAEWTQTLADVGVDFLSAVTGPVGQKIKQGYVATKNIAGGMSEAHSEGTSLVVGAAKGAGNAAIELGFDAAKGKLGKATKGKIPGLPEGPGPSLKKISEFVPETNADKIFKERLIRSTLTHAGGSAAQSQVEGNHILTPLEKKLGLKQ